MRRTGGPAKFKRRTLRPAALSFAAPLRPSQARDHARQLLEKHVKKPFFESAYAAGQPRMSQDELTAGLEWLANRFYVVRYEDEALPSVEWVLEVARVAVLRCVVGGGLRVRRLDMLCCVAACICRAPHDSGCGQCLLGLRRFWESKDCGAAF